MGIFDWLTSSDADETAPSDLSRRAFFAKFATAAQEQPAAPAPPPPPPDDPDALYNFYVDRFRYHDGPILVPSLRVGAEFDLGPDPNHITNPGAIRIRKGRDTLGYVPPDLDAEIRERLRGGERLWCRSTEVNPGAELESVLRVAIGLVEVENASDSDAAAEEADGTPSKDGEPEPEGDSGQEPSSPEKPEGPSGEPDPDEPLVDAVKPADRTPPAL